MRRLAWIALLVAAAPRAYAEPSQRPGSVLVEQFGWTVVLPQWQPSLRSLGELLSAPGASAELDQWLARGLWPDAPESEARLMLLDLMDSSNPLQLNPKSPVAFTMDPKSGVFLLSCELRDTAPLRKRLSERAEQGKLQRQDVWIFDEASSWPISCVLANQRLRCQLGAGSSDEPLEPLAKLASAQAQRAFSKTSSAAVAALHIRPSHIVRRGLAARRALLARGPTSQRRAKRQRRDRQRNLARWAKAVPSLQFELHKKRDAWAIAGGARLSRRASARLASATRAKAGNQAISGWTNTPALVSASMRLSPKALAQAAHRMGWQLPFDGFTGHAGLLVFGVDTECPEARRKSAAGSWQALLPTAVALHVERPATVESQRSVGFQGWQADLRGPIMLVTRGAGAQAAGLRRLQGQPSDREPHDSFFRLDVDLAAVEAALSAIRVSRDHREELLQLQATHEVLRPWLSAWSKMSLRTRHDPKTRVVWVTAALR